jgi:hypothetical protein
MGEYIGRIFEEVKGRPLYVVKDEHGTGLKAPRRREAMTAAKRRGPRRSPCWLSPRLFAWLAWHRLAATAGAARRGPLRRRCLGDGALGRLADADARRPAVLPQAAAVLLDRRARWSSSATSNGRPARALVLGACLAAARAVPVRAPLVDERGWRCWLLVLVTMPWCSSSAQYANLDMLVAGCITATILASRTPPAGRWRTIAEPWRALLAGAYLFAAAGRAGQGADRHRAARAGAGDLAAGDAKGIGPAAVCVVARLGILLAVAAPWFVAMQLKYPAFFDYFVVTQHFRRFASSGFNNEHGIWFYLPVLAGSRCLGSPGCWSRARNDGVARPRRRPTSTG